MNKFFVSKNNFWWFFASIVLGYTFTIGVFNYPLDPRGMSAREVLFIVVLIIFFAFFVFFLGRLIYPFVVGYSLKSRLTWVVVALFVGGILVLVIPLQPEKVSLYLITLGLGWEWLLYLPDVLWISFSIFVISLWLVTRPPQIVVSEKISKGMVFIYALPMMSAWSIYLLAYWPGGMSPDSLDQWNQLLEFDFTDWHPVFHTLTNWLITRFWLSPASVVLSQIVALSLILGWGLAVLRRSGSPRWLTWLTVILFMILPSIGFMVSMLWKDVFYAISVTALTIMILEIVLSRGKWIEERSSWIYLGVIATLVALYRQNGVITAFGTLLVLLIMYRDKWKPFVMAFILAFVLWIGIRGPLYMAMDVNRDVPSGLGMALSHLIARYTNTDVHFSKEDRAFLAEIRPENQWPYDCYMESNLFFDGKLNYSFEKENMDSLAVLALKLIYRDPKVFINHLRCNGSFAYQITQPRNSEYETVVTTVFPNNLGLKTETKLSEAKMLLDSWDGQTPMSVNWLIWRVPFWNYLLFAGIVLYSLRTRNWKSLLIMAPIALNAIPLILLTGGQAFRYVFSSTLVSILMCMPFIFGYLSTSSINPSHPSQQNNVMRKAGV